MKAFTTFIHHNDCLTHLDCSGVFNKANQVKQLIRAVSKSISLQVLHLDYTSLVAKSPSLIAFIVRKLKTVSFFNNHQLGKMRKPREL